MSATLDAMRRTGRWWASLVALAVCLAPSGARAEEPEGLRIEASVSVPMSGTPPTTIVIEPNGAARIVQQPVLHAPQGVTLELTLSAAEMDATRHLVLESHFFDAWGRPPPQRLPRQEPLRRGIRRFAGHRIFCVVRCEYRF